MCLISLYYVYKASRSCLLCFLCHPYIQHFNLKNFLFTSTCLVCTCHAAKVEMTSSGVSSSSCLIHICERGCLLMFTERSLGCWSSGHRNLSMYQVSSSTVFFFVSYMHIHVHAPFIMYCSRLFVVVFQEINCLRTFMFVGSQGFISLTSFMFVSAVVSEIHELNQNKKTTTKKNSEIYYFQFNTFPGHIIYPFFNQRYLLSTCTDLIC